MRVCVCVCVCVRACVCVSVNVGVGVCVFVCCVCLEYVCAEEGGARENVCRYLCSVIGGVCVFLADSVFCLPYYGF